MMGLEVETGDSGDSVLSRLVRGLFSPLPVLPCGGEYRRIGLFCALETSLACVGPEFGPNCFWKFFGAGL